MDGKVIRSSDLIRAGFSYRKIHTWGKAGVLPRKENKKWIELDLVEFEAAKATASRVDALGGKLPYSVVRRFFHEEKDRISAELSNS